MKSLKRRQCNPSKFSNPESQWFISISRFLGKGGLGSDIKNNSSKTNGVAAGRPQRPELILIVHCVLSTWHMGDPSRRQETMFALKKKKKKEKAHTYKQAQDYLQVFLSPHTSFLRYTCISFSGWRRKYSENSLFSITIGKSISFVNHM